jgi:LDH2 family malate/lactate/ureidoglycolate dehydrogenase
LPGVERIWLPGEQSHLKRQDRTKNGIPMAKSLRDSLDAAARELGIAPLG